MSLLLLAFLLGPLLSSLQFLLIVFLGLLVILLVNRIHQLGINHILGVKVDNGAVTHGDLDLAVDAHGLTWLYLVTIDSHFKNHTTKLALDAVHRHMLESHGLEGRHTLTTWQLDQLGQLNDRCMHRVNTEVDDTYLLDIRLGLGILINDGSWLVVLIEGG